MGIDDITEKASDAGIDKAGDAVDQKTGGGHSEKIETTEKTVDEKIGG
ncbi:antitoxin [Cellulomonas marina]|uniref:MT0933-like antitoxin protein n=1 Tax=Cellulomonas marina TaxID=988821 RepID=A0A1I1AQK9_9CELL|nr:antitoxin [Cellulomonas marina]SFB38623.1 MT0933-like antitoxin protein [Cellulomonas marina]